MRFEELVKAYDGARRERNVYHDLMRHRVREVLLVASLFDSFVIESDGILNEQVYGEFYRLNLTSVPRVTSAYTEESALRLFAEGRFDLVILMAGLDFEKPLSLAKRMKSEWPSVQILLMAASNASLEALDRSRPELAYIDRAFVWNGYSKLFVGMLKYVEDLRNVESDTRVGLVRVILLIESSVRWYSRYLPILYRTVMRQTQALIEEESAVETYKLLRARGRPKILLAASYEEAQSIFERYEPYMAAVVSELGFPRGGAEDERAGEDFIGMVRSRKPDLPVIVQSGGEGARAAAARLGAAFADKGSESVEREICDFLIDKLRFGPFRFESEDGSIVAEAKGVEEMVGLLEGLPIECVLRHARRNDYSTWLLARGEVRMARALRGYRLDDFASPEEVRAFLARTLESARREKSRGMLPYFDERSGREGGSMTRLGDGSVGGKGRGILFLKQVLEGADFARAFGRSLEVKLPRSAFIGIDSFERFLESNGLWSFAFYEARGEGGGERVRERFLASPLDPQLRERLRRFAALVGSPLAVRSSGLFEDMILVPFAGAYDTFVIPNSHPDPEVRLERLEAAVKLVYASLFSARSRSRFEATGYALEEERMAVIVQELVGSRRGRWFYPHASGGAQSCNYYPLAYARPEDGICVAALGLGTGSAQEGGAFRFCPRYPTLESAPPKRLLEGGQRAFLALDMEDAGPDPARVPEAALSRVDLAEAERDPLFWMLASTWDAENDRLTPGVSSPGPRVVDFGNILKYDALPLAEAISMTLDIGERAMRAAVEIEYALNIDEPGGVPALYLLQMRPLVRSEEPSEAEIDGAAPEDCFIVSPRSMGNGRDRAVADIVWVDPRTFDRAATEAMAAEIGELDREMRELGRRYLLVGPGRWGTRDRWLGVPVAFSQISMARAIVEADIPGLSVESSLGSHFFHNVTSMKIGYLTVPLGGEGRVDWDWLYSFEPERRAVFCARTRLPEPLGLLMDGRRSRAIVLKRAVNGASA